MKVESNYNLSKCGLVWLVLVSFGLGFCSAAEKKQAEAPAIEPPQEIKDIKEIEETKKAEQVPVVPKEAEKITPPQGIVAFSVEKIKITGNELISTEDLIKKLPDTYNSSDIPIERADSMFLYDLTVIKDILAGPGRPREVTARTISGFTQYILSTYQKKGLGGIYVFVPSESITSENKLKDNTLIIRIVEAKLSKVNVNFFDSNSTKVEQGYLNREILEEWLPIKSGKVADMEKLDDTINLLNLNPDRYISSKVSAGAEPDTLDVSFDIYEVNPWHFFLQVDNAGTKDREWTPRFGIINTNTTGRDDRLTLMLQGPIDESPKNNYSIFGSYEVPIWTPKLRLNVFAGRSEFDVDGGGGIDFLGNGSFYGGILKLNIFQENNWFIDISGSLRHIKSKVTPSIFASVLGTDITMDLWGAGFDIYHKDDMSNTTFSFQRLQSFETSAGSAFNRARTGADTDFAITTFDASHYQYIDPDKIQRILGSFRLIKPTDRLVPAQMTTFGGMYSVRGYEESEIVADGGILWSFQYEYDLVKHDQAEQARKSSTGSVKPEEQRKPWLRKVAPLVFFDYGKAETRNALAGEYPSQELYSLGIGMLVEVGDNFNAAVYYGHPLNRTDDTDVGDGRVNVSLMYRW
ncbi:MAG: ShlB/FhaC/HecB family hemolysin secretion/activation protein [Planctomycetota bacterium]